MDVINCLRLLYFIYFYFILFPPCVVASIDDDFHAEMQNLLALVAGVVIPPIVDAYYFFDNDGYGRKEGQATIPRVRRHISQIFMELGATQLRRAYRMSEASFWRLLDLIAPKLPLVGISGRQCWFFPLPRTIGETQNSNNS